MGEIPMCVKPLFVWYVYTTAGDRDVLPRHGSCGLPLAEAHVMTGHYCVGSWLRSA
jgi:hypothetical protein